MLRLLRSFNSYMRFAHRHGPRTRWRDEQGRWDVRGRVERFIEPALLVLLSEQSAHGYQLVDRVAGLVPANGRARWSLPRAWRARRGRAGDVRMGRSRAGPAKRMYELTPAGRDLLRAWAKALKQTQVVVDAFPTLPSKGGEHARSSPSPPRPPRVRPLFGSRWYSSENVLERLENTSATSNRNSPTSPICSGACTTAAPSPAHPSRPPRSTCRDCGHVSSGHASDQVRGAWPEGGCSPTASRRRGRGSRAAPTRACRRRGDAQRRVTRGRDHDPPTAAPTRYPSCVAPVRAAIIVPGDRATARGRGCWRPACARRAAASERAEHDGRLKQRASEFTEEEGSSAAIATADTATSLLAREAPARGRSVWPPRSTPPPPRRGATLRRFPPTSNVSMK